MTSAPGAAASRLRALASATSRQVTHRLGARTVRLATFGAVFLGVLSLPLSGAGGGTFAMPASARAASAVSGDLLASAAADARVLPVSRAHVLLQQRTPLTVTRQSPAEVKQYTVQDGDTLLVIAGHFDVSPETIAYNNAVTDARSIHPGNVFRIPPMDGAIYKVKDGDTVDSVAALFKVEAKAIMDTNRLYFEPENFQAGKEVLVPVPDARYPNFELKDAPKWKPPVYATAGQDTQAVARPAAGRLAWPVGGVLTQYFWYGHKGVDIAAPYGRGIGASDEGVVSATGWVAVGGLRVCVKHDWGMETCYYHTSAVHVAVGQRVAKGQILASIGMTGLTTGPHVHWEARLNGVLVNPLAY